MTMYECANCTEDSCNEPIVQIVLTQKVLANHNKEFNNFAILHSGWHYKPELVTDEEWSKITDMESNRYFEIKNKVLIQNSRSFCSLKCAIEFLKKERDENSYRFCK